MGINHGFQRLRVVSGEVELGGLVLELLDEHLVDVLIVEELVGGVQILLDERKIAGEQALGFIHGLLAFRSAERVLDELPGGLLVLARVGDGQVGRAGHHGAQASLLDCGQSGQLGLEHAGQVGAVDQCGDVALLHLPRGVVRCSGQLDDDARVVRLLDQFHGLDAGLAVHGDVAVGVEVEGVLQCSDNLPSVTAVRVAGACLVDAKHVVAGLFLELLAGFDETVPCGDVVLGDAGLFEHLHVVDQRSGVHFKGEPVDLSVTRGTLHHTGREIVLEVIRAIIGQVGKRVGELVHVAADVVDAHVHDVGQTLAASSEPCGDLVPDGGVTDVLDLHRRTGIGFLESLRGGFERFARLLPRPDGDGATDLCRFLRVLARRPAGRHRQCQCQRCRCGHCLTDGFAHVESLH